jgi:hypothetical protein
MKNLIRELPLPNGLTVSFFDHTSRYFGDFHRVKMEIICNVPVFAEYFEDRSAFDDAKALLSDEVVYKHCVEQMGVPSTEIERVLQRIMTNFIEHSLPYFESAQFPRKMVLAALNKIKGKKMRTLYI